MAAFETLMRCLFALPRFSILDDLKSAALRAMGAEVGSGCTFYPGLWICTGKNLRLGSGVDLAVGTLITTDGGVTIGDRTLVGYGVKVLSSNHRVPPLPGRIIDAGHETDPVSIGSDCWIGANSVILPGVTIGDGTVVASGAVVTTNLPANVVAVGVPARVLRSRE